MLMDRETLLAHRDRWGTEERPARSALTRLTAEEADLYAELVSRGRVGGAGAVGAGADRLGAGAGAV